MGAAQKHAEVGKLFLDVCDLSAEEGSTYLDRACGRDRELRAAVEALLREDSHVEDLLAERAARARLCAPVNRLRAASEGLLATGNHGSRSSSVGFQTATRPAAGIPNIAGYQINGIVGQGGMGVVYRATEINLDREVAIKILPAVFGEGKPTAVERFRREAAAAARLHHENIVDVYDFGQSNGHYYYTMQLVDGDPLNVIIRRWSAEVHNATSTSHVEGCEPVSRSLIDRSSSARTSAEPSKVYTNLPHPFTPDYFKLVAHWIAGAAKALQVAHEHGVIHRDIKPGNLILSHGDRLMITDFGLALTEYEDTITRTGAIMGTLRYLSPELALGGRVPVDRRTDIYALGVTLYELLTLRPIYSGVSEAQLLAAVIGQEPPRPTALNPSVPLDLETICLKALEKRPSGRYMTADKFASDLGAFQDGSAIAARRPSVPARIKKVGVRHRVGIGLFAAVALFMVATMYLLGFRATARLNQQVGDLVSRGLVMQQDHRWNDASQAYQEAIALDAKNVRALGNLAIIRKEQYEAQPDPDPALLMEADDLCNRALAISSQKAGLWNVKGVIQKKLGAYEDAIASYEKGLQVDGASVEITTAILNNLAEAHWLLGDTEAAEASMQMAVQVATDTNTPVWYVWQDFASLQLAQGNLNAEHSIQRAFDSKSEPNWRLHVTRARIHLVLDGAVDVQAALRDAYAAMEEQSQDPRVARIMALALLRTGDFDNSIVQAQNALDLGDVAAFDHLIATIAEAKRGRLKAAQRQLNAASETWPTALVDAGYLVSTERAMLWFDTADELTGLWAEAESSIYETP